MIGSIDRRVVNNFHQNNNIYKEIGLRLEALEHRITAWVNNNPSQQDKFKLQIILLTLIKLHEDLLAPYSFINEDRVVPKIMLEGIMPLIEELEEKSPANKALCDSIKNLRACMMSALSDSKSNSNVLLELSNVTFRNLRKYCNNILLKELKNFDITAYSMIADSMNVSFFNSHPSDKIVKKFDEMISISQSKGHLNREKLSKLRTEIIIAVTCLNPNELKRLHENIMLRLKKEKLSYELSSLVTAMQAIIYKSVPEIKPAVFFPKELHNGLAAMNSTIKLMEKEEKGEVGIYCQNTDGQKIEICRNPVSLENLSEAIDTYLKEGSKSFYAIRKENGVVKIYEIGKEGGSVEALMDELDWSDPETRRDLDPTDNLYYGERFEKFMKDFCSVGFERIDLQIS